jgi:hypothetical protein
MKRKLQRTRTDENMLDVLLAQLLAAVPRLGPAPKIDRYNIIRTIQDAFENSAPESLRDCLAKLKRIIDEHKTDQDKLELILQALLRPLSMKERVKITKAIQDAYSARGRPDDLLNCLAWSKKLLLLEEE